MKKIITEQKKAPEVVQKFKSGKLSTTIFEFEKKNDEGKEYKAYSVAIQKGIHTNEKDEQGKDIWKNELMYLSIHELTQAIIILEKAREFLLLNE